MATKAAEGAKKAAKLAPRFRVGEKKVYLPNIMITMLPPRRVKSPYFATFQVPLRFNKLDMRDYLFHAYGVEVRSVRSWLTPVPAVKRYSDMESLRDPRTGKIDTKTMVMMPGPWMRPQPIKRMMVELVKPFVYPKLDVEEAKRQADADGKEDTPWDTKMFERSMKSRTEQIDAEQRTRHQLDFRRRIDENHVPAFRAQLARQAQALVRGEQSWSNDLQELDPKFDELEGEAAGREVVEAKAAESKEAESKEAKTEDKPDKA